MFNAVPGPKPYISEQNATASSHALSLGQVDTPNTMVTSAVDAIISQFAPAYLELINEATVHPEIISDYKSSLYDYYKDMSLTPEIRRDVSIAQEIAPNCKVVTKALSSQKKISVFSENNSEFDGNQAIEKARLHINLRVNAKDLKKEDPLTLLLSQLSKKILSLGYGNEGTFDVRLEKGILPLEGNPWKWHFDGEIFKSSITVCYSNKKNWSTRISGGKPAEHSCLYDALKVYHRAPIPSDLEGKELNADDYRLFIRYNEFYTANERATSDSNEAEKGRRSHQIF